MSRVLMVDLEMVPFDGECCKQEILYEAVLVRVSRSGLATMMSSIVKAGPAWKQDGTSLVLMSQCRLIPWQQ